MKINNDNYDLIYNALQSYVRELFLTKKGKPSKLKYKRNKHEIFNTLSLMQDIYLEFNKDKIKEDIQKYLSQFVDVRDVAFGDKCIFQVKWLIYIKLQI